MAQWSTSSHSEAHGGIYEDGPHKVEVVSVAGWNSSSSCGPKNRVAENRNNLPPKPLLVVLPKEEGEYPVVQFQHGFTLQNTFYSQLMSHVASYGFIVVAPQMYTLSGSDATGEIEDAVSILNWMPTGLVASMPEALTKHRPNFERVALVGHSRGGKVAFGLALGVRNSILQYSAVVGLDPVDGTAKGSQTNPPILKFSKNSLNLGVPTLIVGAGLGRVRKNFLFPPCAPEGVSHEAFFFDSSAPAFHFVASEYGHMDYLNDDCSGPAGKLSYCVCKNGPARGPMRRFAGGILVAFLQAALLNITTSFNAALSHPELAPVLLEPPESWGEFPAVRTKTSLTPGMVIGTPVYATDQKIKEKVSTT